MLTRARRPNHPSAHAPRATHAQTPARSTLSTRCLRCPNAFHLKCVPDAVRKAAESAGIWPNRMICDMHPQPAGAGLRGPWSVQPAMPSWSPPDTSEDQAACVLQAISGGMMKGLQHRISASGLGNDDSGSDTSSDEDSSSDEESS